MSGDSVLPVDDFVQGVASAGSAINSNPVPAGIYDGTDVQYAVEMPVVSSTATRTGAGYNGLALWSGTSSVSPAVNLANATPTNIAGTGSISAGIFVYNGSYYDAVRTANAAKGTTGTGLLGVGSLVWDGVDWQVPFGTPDGGLKTAAVAGGTSIAVKALPGRLCRVLVTAVGTAAVTIYDNASAASGTVIGVIPATAAVGTIVDFGMPAAAGIYASSPAGAVGVTISYV